MRNRWRQFANTIVLAAVLVAAIATALLAPPFSAQSQSPAMGIDPKLLAMANAGDAKSQLLVGFDYEKGDGVSTDPNKAAVWYREAAEGGDATAQFILAWENYDGIGVPKDTGQADTWFRKAAAQVDMIDSNLAREYPPIVAMNVLSKSDKLGGDFFYLGDLYEEGKYLPQDYSQAALWYREGAKQGDLNAQSSLGVLYTEGKGVPQDYELAAAWFHRAAEQGYVDAQVNVGSLYLEGRGVPQDYKKAKEWLDKAANQGSAAALYNLGVMYAKGQGVQQNSVGAYLCFDLAAARLTGPDQVSAEKGRDLAATLLTPEELSKAQEAAEKWFDAHPARR